MHRQFLTGAAVIALAASLAACGQPTGQKTEGEVGAGVSNVQDAAGVAVGAGTGAVAALSTEAFVTEAAVAGMYEIEASKLALTKSSNSGVKKLAQMIIDDHTKAAAELKGLVDAGKAPGPLPAGLDERRQGNVDNLKTASVSDFDDRYLDQQGAAHNEALMAFNGYKDHGDNADLKAFAAKTIPTLDMHKQTIAGLDKGTPADDSAGADSKPKM